MKHAATGKNAEDRPIIITEFVARLECFLHSCMLLNLALPWIEWYLPVAPYKCHRQFIQHYLYTANGSTYDGPVLPIVSLNALSSLDSLTSLDALRSLESLGSLDAL